MARHVAVSADRRVVCMRADYRHALDLARVEREQALVVLEQNDRFARRLAGQRDRIGRLGLGRGGLDVDIGVFEQPGVELELENTAHRLVDLRLANPALADQLGQQRIGLRVGGLEVDGRVERADRRVAEIVEQLVPRHQLADREIVAEHHALEAPFLAQHVVEQPAIGMARDAVDLVVRGHHRHHRQLGHGALERREEDFAQRAFGDGGGADIGAALGLAVPGHVLERHIDLVLGERQRGALEAADRCEAHLADQIGVLAIGLLDPAPARIARDVDHRGEREVRAACAHLARGDREDLLLKLGIPRAGERDRLREAGRAGGDITVQRLLVHDQGDAEPGLLDRPFLRGVDVARGILGTAIDGSGGGTRGGALGDRAAVIRARDLAEAIGEVLARLLRVEFAFGRLDLLLLQPDRDHLLDLLLQRHPLEQIFDPRVDRLRGVLVERLVGAGALGVRDECGGRSQRGCGQHG